MGNVIEREGNYTIKKSGFYTDEEETAVNECMEAIVNQIYDCMRQKDWTLTKMAFECNISYSQLCRILRRDGSDIRLFTLVRIASGVGKPLSCFLGGGKQQKGGAI